MDLDIIAQADQIGGQTPIVLVGSGTPGKQTLSDMRLRLSCRRTKAAKSAGRVHTQPVSYYGSIGTHVVIELSSGETQRNSGPAGNPQTDVPDNLPCFRRNRWVRTINDWAGTSQDVAALPLIIPRGDRMAVFANTAGTWPISLPTIRIGHGHELTLRNISAAGTFMSLAATGAGANLPAQRVIAPGGQITLRFDEEAGQWLEVAPPAPLRATANLTIAAIPAAGTSPELSVPCSGAAPGMNAAATPLIDLGADFEISGVRAVTNAVRFRLRNLGAASAAPPSASWSVTATYAG